MVGVVGLAFVVVAGLMIAVFVLTIVWQWRLAKNHQLLGRPDTAFGPGWAIGAWFIPLANFVIPILQLRDPLEGLPARPAAGVAGRGSGSRPAPCSGCGGVCSSPRS